MTRAHLRVCLEGVVGEDERKNMIWKEGNILFNDILNTFYLQLYGIRHMVKEGRKCFI